MSEAHGQRTTVAPRQQARRSSAMVAYLLLLVSLQVFLIVVAVEGLQGDDPALARAAAVLSIAVFVGTVALRWFLGEN